MAEQQGDRRAGERVEERPGERVVGDVGDLGDAERSGGGVVDDHAVQQVRQQVGEHVRQFVEVAPVHVPAVVVGLALIAVAVCVGLSEVAEVVLDWRWVAAGVLLLSGAAVLLAVLAAGIRRTLREEEARR